MLYAQLLLKLCMCSKTLKVLKAYILLEKQEQNNISYTNIYTQCSPFLSHHHLSITAAKIISPKAIHVTLVPEIAFYITRSKFHPILTIRH